MKFLRYFLPIAVLAASGAVTWWLISSRPEPSKRFRDNIVPIVQYETLQPQDYTVSLESQGTVEARTQSDLIPEVRGRVVQVAPSFRVGGFFEKGELLLEIDPENYEHELVVAEANLATMELRYEEEKARSKQAMLNWERLNGEQETSPLVLRKPQMKQAEANLASAQARVSAAKLDLERTKIIAPFAGRVLQKNVDVGQYVSPGNRLATLYAIDSAEVRLPLSEAQLGFIDLPELYRGDDLATVPKIPVTLTANLGAQEHTWEGNLVRAEGAFDTASRQLFVIAQVDNPYARAGDGRPPLKVGTYVDAQIEGRNLKDVFIIPRSLYRENQYILIINEKNRIERRYLDPIWSDEQSVIINRGIEDGERICTTYLKYATNGMKVAFELPEHLQAEQSENNMELLESVLQALPDGTELPIYLTVELDSVRADGDPKRANQLLWEIRRWARLEEIALPDELFERGKRMRKAGKAKAST